MTDKTEIEALLDAVRADREAGTPGPWRYMGHGEVVFNDLSVMPLVCTIDLSNTSDGQGAADTRRIARVPDLETAVLDLAAETANLRRQLAEAQTTITGLRAQISRLMEETPPPAQPDADVQEAALKWEPCECVTTDDDGGPREGKPRKLSAWKSGDYLIVKQDSEHGLFILGTPDGKGQVAHHAIDGVIAAANAHRNAALSALPPREVTVQEAARVLLDETPNPIFDILKPVLMGDYHLDLFSTDEEGEEHPYRELVSWAAIKQIVHDTFRALADQEGR